MPDTVAMRIAPASLAAQAQKQTGMDSGAELGHEGAGAVRQGMKQTPLDSSRQTSCSCWNAKGFLKFNNLEGLFGSS